MGAHGSESMFLVELGSEDGVRVGSAVVTLDGLVGRIHQVGENRSEGMDWTHPDFQASAMLQDGTAYGMVDNRRGAFREEDGLILNGVAYYESVAVGTRVLTSGLGGTLQRGIPIGQIDGVEDVQGRWSKSYRLRPMVEPGSVTHVIVLTESASADLAGIWPPDSLVARLRRDPD